VKQTSQPLAAMDVARDRPNFAVRFDDGVFQTLMVPFRGVVNKVLANGEV